MEKVNKNAAAASRQDIGADSSAALAPALAASEVAAGAAKNNLEVALSMSIVVGS